MDQLLASLARKRKQYRTQTTQYIPHRDHLEECKLGKGSGLFKLQKFFEGGKPLTRKHPSTSQMMINFERIIAKRFIQMKAPKQGKYWTKSCSAGWF